MPSHSRGELNNNDHEKETRIHYDPNEKNKTVQPMVEDNTY